MKSLSSATIVDRRDLTERLFCLKLRPGIPFRFKPGQYCTIGLPDSSGKLIERAYSIASSPQEQLIELFIELIPEGALTPLLWQLRVGDSVTFRPKPKGIFTFEPKYPNQIMVATATGIVPYVSIIRDYDERRLSGHRFFVLQGCSYWDQFVYDSELKDMQDRICLEYVPTLSRPQESFNSDWLGKTGRVNLILEDYLRHWQLFPEESILYLCGNPGMITDVKERLPLWRIKEERFWK